MAYRLTDVEWWGDLKTETWVNEFGDVTEVKSQDTTRTLEMNRAEINSHEHVNPGEHFVKAASIPPIIQIKWLQEGVDILNPDHADEVDRRLNSNEWAYLRTAPGRI